VELFLGWAQRAGRNCLTRHSFGAKGETAFGGPEPLTDTPTPYGCGKDPCSLDTGRKSSLSRPQRHPHPTGVGWSFPSDQTLRRLRSLRGFSPVVRDLETSASTIHPLRGIFQTTQLSPTSDGFSPHLSELRKTPSPAGHSRKGLSARPPSSTISSTAPSSYLKAEDDVPAPARS
jgi:hypothetical protein